MAAVANSSIKKLYTTISEKCVPKKIFLFFVTGNQILKYHGDKSVIAWKTQECGVVAICFLEIHFRIYPFYHSFSYADYSPVKCS